MTRIKDIKNPTKKILFLGYSQSQTKLIDAPVANNCIVDQVIPPFVGLFETRITRPIYTGSVS